MPGVWDAPPTEDEVSKSTTNDDPWAAPPSADEMEAAGVEPTPATAPPEPSIGDHLTGFVHGAERGFGSEWTDEFGALGQVSSGLLARTQPREVTDLLGIESRYDEPLSLKQVLGEYRQARGENRMEYGRSDKLAPNANTVGNFVGGMLQPGPIGKKEAGAKGAKALWKAGERLAAAKVVGKAAGKAAGRGAIEGGLSGLGASEADLTKGDLREWARAAADVGINTGVGALLGPGGLALGSALEVPIEWIGKKIKKGALQRGAGYLAGGRGTIQDLKAVPETSVEDAITKGGIKRWDTIGDTAERLKGLRKGAGKEIEDVITKGEEAGLEDLLGAYTSELRRRGDAEFKRTADSSIRDIYLKKAGEIEDVFRDGSVFKDAAGRFESDADMLRVPVRSINEWKKSAAKKAKFDTIKGSLPNDAYKDVARVFQEGEDRIFAHASDIAPPRSGLKRLSNRFDRAKDSFGLIAKADDAAEKSAHAAARKPPKASVGEAVGNVAGSVTMGQPIPTGTVLKAATSAVKDRLVSTGVVNRYALSQLAKPAAKAAPQALAKVARAAQRAATPEISDAFWEMFLRPSPKGTAPDESEEERKLRELRETLRGRPD